MENGVLHRHRAQVSRNYIRRIANEIKTDKFTDAAHDTIILASILKLWGVQESRRQEKALRGVENNK